MVSKKPMKECNSVGCAELISEGTYCEKHKGERERYYDKYVRDQESRKLYQSKEWQRVRQYVIAKGKGLCVRCLANKQFIKFDVVDHIIPVQVDWSRRLDPDNCQLLCHACHNRKTNEDIERYGKH